MYNKDLLDHSRIVLSTSEQEEAQSMLRHLAESLDKFAKTKPFAGQRETDIDNILAEARWIRSELATWKVTTERVHLETVMRLSSPAHYLNDDSAYLPFNKFCDIVVAERETAARIERLRQADDSLKRFYAGVLTLVLVVGMGVAFYMHKHKNGELVEQVQQLKQEIRQYESNKVR